MTRDIGLAVLLVASSSASAQGAAPAETAQSRAMPAPPVPGAKPEAEASAAPEATPADAAAIRIIEAYQDGATTRFVIQSRAPLVTGRSLYLGSSEDAATVGPLMSKLQGLHYYTASAPGKLRVHPGDSVRLEKTARQSLPAAVLGALSARRGFEAKSVAEVTAVQGDRLLIDRGTLHEVHERDFYRIMDASGTIKGLLEVRGIGDLQSSAIFHNEKAARTAAGLAVVPGDYAVFVGQRRLFGIGIIGGQQLERRQVLYAFDKSAGGGLLWSLTFHNGWGLETLFGYYEREASDSTVRDIANPLNRATVYDKRSAKYLAPIWAKKNFFYPSLISPFAAGGLYWFDGSHEHQTQDPYIGATASPLVVQKVSKRGVYPVLGVGVEFFPARFFRPRLEVRQFYGPDLTAQGNVFRTNSTFYSIGILSSW